MSRRSLVAVCCIGGLLSLAADPYASLRATHRAAEPKLTGKANVRFDKATQAPLVMQSFSFRFGNGDHKIRNIQAFPGNGTEAEIEFSDVDANDPYSTSVVWLAMPNARKLHKKEWGCVGTCQLSIEPPKPGEFFALTGFMFRRNPPVDMNLRQIAIRPKPDKSVVEIVYRDNGGSSGTLICQPAPC